MSHIHCCDEVDPERLYELEEALRTALEACEEAIATYEREEDIPAPRSMTRKAIEAARAALGEKP